MTLLTALREHPQIRRARTAYQLELKTFPMRGTAAAVAKQNERRKRAWDRLVAALVTACLQEAAKRIREKNAAHVKAMEGYHNRAVAMTWNVAADYLDQMAKESAE